MKKALLAIIIIGALSAVYFYANQTQRQTATASTTTASLPLPVVKPVAPAMSAPKVSIAETKPTAAAAPSLAKAAPAAVDSSAMVSPRAELFTTVPELARLINAQDYGTLMQDFMPPDELEAMLTDLGQPGQPMKLPDLANVMRQSPRFVQQMAGAAQFMNYLQTQTPTFDATGENASYKMPNVVNGMDTINFVKVGGYWYVKNGREFFR